MRNKAYSLVLVGSLALLPAVSAAQDIEAENSDVAVVSLEPAPRVGMVMRPAASSNLNLQMSCEMRTASRDEFVIEAAFGRGRSHGDPIPVEMDVSGSSAFSGEGHADYRVDNLPDRVLEFVAHRDQYTLKFSFANVRRGEAAQLTVSVTQEFTPEAIIEWRPYAVGFCRSESLNSRNRLQ